MSLHVAVADCPAPSVVTYCQGWSEFVPESASAGVRDVTESVGGVRSMKMLARVLEAVFCTRSTHVAVACWFWPSVLTTCVMDGWTVPERASVQVQFSVTSPLAQPFALG